MSSPFLGSPRTPAVDAGAVTGIPSPYTLKRRSRAQPSTGSSHGHGRAAAMGISRPPVQPGVRATGVTSAEPLPRRPRQRSARRADAASRLGHELGREGVDGFFGPSTERASAPSSRSAGCWPTASWAPTPGASWSRPATRSATGCSTSASRRSAATTCWPCRSSSTCWASTPAPSAASTTTTWSAP